MATSNPGGEYNLEALHEAYSVAVDGLGTGPFAPEKEPFAPWSLFEDAYGEGASSAFLNAVDCGDIVVYETEQGTRSDGHWPRYNTGRLWLTFKL